jgi:hypothetical protein
MFGIAGLTEPEMKLCCTCLVVLAVFHVIGYVLDLEPTGLADLFHSKVSY